MVFNNEFQKIEYYLERRDPDLEQKFRKYSWDKKKAT